MGSKELRDSSSEKGIRRYDNRAFILETSWTYERSLRQIQAYVAGAFFTFRAKN